MSDNGACDRSTIQAFACQLLDLNTCGRGPTDRAPIGKPERFIRTLLGGWAYGTIYRTSPERTAAVDEWL